MTDPPFTPCLRLTVAVDDRGGLPQGPGWRDRLRNVRTREPSSQVLASDVVPSTSAAMDVLARSFANHPMVNLGGRASGGEIERGAPGLGPQAYVIAEIVLQPDLGETPAGGAYRDGLDSLIGEPYPVHATPWPYEAHSEGEDVAARELLKRVVADLPLGLWRNDG